MPRKYVCLFILVFAGFLAQAQKNWVDKNLSEKVSISFPAEPNKISETSYGLKDSTGVVFISNVSDIAKAINLDIISFDSVVVEKSFANDFLDGFKPSMPKYTFSPVIISSLTGRTTYQFEGRNEQDKSTVFFIAVFLEGIAYSFTCILPDGKSVMDKNLFFKGIKIKN